MNYRATTSCVRRQASVIRVAASVFALLVVPAILNGKNLVAQANIPQTKTTHQRETVIGKDGRRSSEIDADAVKASRTASEAGAERPETLRNPSWPADHPPNPATVRWDSRGLEIDASNSSLDQILRQVAAQTGARLEGLIWDRRIFGKYGPGPGCDVLAKLLEGTGYNVLISGSRDAGVPREVILSSRLPITPQAATNNRTRDHSEASSQVEPEPREEDSSEQASRPQNQDPFNIGSPPRDRVELMQEILQRQNVIDQQQQQQQEQRNNP